MSGIMSAKRVNKSYGSHHVLKNISLTVEEGETFAIIGPNGAGKTTLFKVMTGEVGCESGTINYAGQDITRMPAHDRVALGMARTFQVARVFHDVTVRENIVVAVEARRRRAKQDSAPWYVVRPRSEVVDEAESILRDVDLLRKAGEDAKYLSHGDKKRLEFAIALAGRPRILMLDEPTAGMSPTDRVATTELIARLRKESGLTVVMTEHDMDVIFGLATRILVMNQGETIAVGTVEEVRANSHVRDVYLGKEMYHAES